MRSRVSGFEISARSAARVASELSKVVASSTMQISTAASTSCFAATVFSLSKRIGRVTGTAAGCGDEMEGDDTELCCVSIFVAGDMHAALVRSLAVSSSHALSCSCACFVVVLYCASRAWLRESRTFASCKQPGPSNRSKGLELSIEWLRNTRDGDRLLLRLLLPLSSDRYSTCISGACDGLGLRKSRGGGERFVLRLVLVPLSSTRRSCARGILRARARLGDGERLVLRLLLVPL